MDVETYTELQDKQIKRLIVEIMGKHSNIILINENNKIIDSIKHIDSDISSFREIMPARLYTLPPMQDKVEPDTMEPENLFNGTFCISKKTDTFLVDSIMGFSPFLAKNICYLSDVNPKTNVENLTQEEILKLTKQLNILKENLLKGNFSPIVIFDNINKNAVTDFYCIPMQSTNIKYFSSINEAVDEYYIAKDSFERLKSKKSTLVKIVNTTMSKIEKKIHIYNENLREIINGDKFKLYGDLILAFIHSIPPNSDKVILSNFYSDNVEDIEVPLDPTITPQQTATTYYKKYNKAKNTFNSCTKLLKEAQNELVYFENVLYMLEQARSNDEIEEIRIELINVGIIHKKNNSDKKHKKSANKSQKLKSKPYHIKSSDGYNIYIGKNNIQNDHLTLKDSGSNDLWLHTKDIPGSHIIIKKEQGEIPENTILEAAILAAHFSKARLSSKVPVDYTLVKYVKKPHGAKPGMVIYTQQKTVFITPNEEKLQKLLYNIK
jgi:predicted ribosome quality control (RQC) complex YloA/Tae2 family protein